MKLNELVQSADFSKAVPFEIYQMDEYFNSYAHYESDYDDKWNARVKIVYVMQWYCTDETVGGGVLFFDGAPVAWVFKASRKSDLDICWVSREKFESLRTFYHSLKKDDFVISSLDEHGDAELGNSYSINYDYGASGINFGIYQGEKVKIIHKPLYDSIAKKVILRSPMDTEKFNIELHDGTLKTVPCKDVTFPFLNLI